MKWVELGEITNVSSGQGAPQGDDSYSFHRGIPFIKAGDMEFLASGGFIGDIQKVEQKVAEENKLSIYPKNSIVFAKSGMSAKKDRVYCLETDSYVVNHLAIIKPNNEGFLSKFLTYYLQFFKPSKLIQDESYPSIRISDIRNLKFPLPSLSEQKKIVAKLDRAQRLIDIDREMLAKYDELIQSVFLEMFGDPVTNPKGWEKKELDKFSEVQIGPFGSLLHKEDYIEDGIPLVNPKNIIGSRIIPDGGKTITSKKAKELGKYILKENDVVLARRGRMGRCAVVTKHEDGFLCGTGSIIIRSELNPTLLSKILSSKSMASHLEEVANGITMKNLNSKIVSGLKIPIPPVEIINQYEEIITFIDSEKFQQKVFLKNSGELFSSLLQEAFG